MSETAKQRYETAKGNWVEVENGKIIDASKPEYIGISESEIDPDVYKPVNSHSQEASSDSQSSSSSFISDAGRAIGNAGAEATKFMLFPLGSTVYDIAKSLPEGTLKKLVDEYGVYGAGGIDMALNAAAVTGLGTPLKAGSVALGLGGKLVGRGLRRATEVAAAPKKSLSDIYKPAADKLEKTAQRSVETLKNNYNKTIDEANKIRDSFQSNRLLKNTYPDNSKKIFIDSKGNVVAPKDIRQSIMNDQKIKGLDLSLLKKQEEALEKEILNSSLLQASQSARTKALVPDMVEVTGNLAGKGASIYGIKSIYDYMMGKDKK